MAQNPEAPERSHRPASQNVTRSFPPDYLPARMLNEFVYCPRLFFYEWVEGLFAHSADTVEGELRHEKIEGRDEELPPPGVEENFQARSVMLGSEQRGLVAKIDLADGEGRTVIPVDYKKGHPAKGPDGPLAWQADRVQVCAQALILRDNGYTCDEAVIYYDSTRQRVRVAITEELVAETLEALAAARRVAARGEIPPPLVDSPKCPRCSLVGICLPDETTLSAAASVGSPQTQLELFPAEELPSVLPSTPPEPRRLVPARDDLRPLYVTGYNLTIGKSGGVLRVKERERTIQEVRINEISQLNVFGNVQLTASALQGLCWSEKPIAHFSYGGWFYGLTTGLGLKNVFLRRAQFRRAEDELFRLHVARALVATKIRNQRTLLMRNHVEPPTLALRQLKHYANIAESAGSLDELLGIEGTAARLYFEHFTGMIKQEPEHNFSFDFERRKRRPPTDPINALLSFAYALLTKDLTIVCHTIGFDPFLGFFHEPRFGRPALALDLMEGFRPLIGDSAVITAVNTRMVTPRDFIRVGPAVALTNRGRKAFLRAYEQRMDTLVTHPMFGYRVNYRRVLEIQARLLARAVTGEIPRYVGFETR